MTYLKFSQFIYLAISIMRLILYQTLEDRDNPDYIENHGPFFCNNNTAWLGYGYYFWDAHEELGHWWGKLNYKQKYVVCKARGTFDEFCWDLQGNGLHRIEFERICDELVSAGVTTKESLLVPQVIEFFKKKGKFLYDSIRALGINSISSKLNDNTIIFRMLFKKDSYAYLDLKPPVQVCLIQKKALSLQHYKIIYPKDYSEFYA